jgi:Leucine-rich repeat (LRR) protein
MANTAITIYPLYDNNKITSINCGTSSPKLGGKVDISSYPNLTTFICIGNDITSLSGYNNNSNLKNLQFGLNKISGQIPSLTKLNSIEKFECHENQFTGSIPSLSGLSNLQLFYCQENQLTGSIPSLSGLSNLRYFSCQENQLTGSIPSLSANKLLNNFQCQNQLGTTKLTGSIPSLSGLINLGVFFCHDNQLTGSIPSLSGLINLARFYCHDNQLTGSIPSLSGLMKMIDFHCYINQLTGFDGGSVPNILGNFQAQNNQLTSTAVDAILSAFDATTRTTGTRILNLQSGNNSAPSYTGGVTTTSLGSNFSRTGTLVTANVNNHGHTNGNLVTITGIPQTSFQGTFTVTVTGPNQFQYTTVTSGSITGTGTATMRRTTNANDGFRSYQNLALVTRLGGFPWNININFP